MRCLDAYGLHAISRADGSHFFTCDTKDLMIGDIAIDELQQASTNTVRALIIAGFNSVSGFLGIYILIKIFRLAYLLSLMGCRDFWTISGIF